MDDDEEVAAREYNAYVRIKGLSSKLNPIDANGKFVPKAKKLRRSRFRGVAWVARRGKWRARYTDVSTPAKRVDVGDFSDDEVAAFFYNEAVTAAGLEHLRPMNRVDATGRPLPRED